MRRTAFRKWVRSVVAVAVAPALGGLALQACTSSSNDTIGDGGMSNDDGGGSPEASCGAQYSFVPQKFKCCAPDSPGFCCGYDGVLDAAPALVEAGLLDDGGSVIRPACDSFCAPGFPGCGVSQAGPPFGFTCSTDCTGRRAGPSTEEASPRDLRDYFSRIAELEAESVVAFESIGRALRKWKAPPSLRRAVSRARREEIRHARIGRALAMVARGMARESALAARTRACSERDARRAHRFGPRGWRS